MAQIPPAPPVFETACAWTRPWDFVVRKDTMTRTIELKQGVYDFVPHDMRVRVGRAEDGRLVDLSTGEHASLVLPQRVYQFLVTYVFVHRDIQEAMVYSRELELKAYKPIKPWRLTIRHVFAGIDDLMAQRSGFAPV